MTLPWPDWRPSAAHPSTLTYAGAYRVDGAWVDCRFRALDRYESVDHVASVVASLRPHRISKVCLARDFRVEENGMLWLREDPLVGAPLPEYWQARDDRPPETAFVAVTCLAFAVLARIHDAGLSHDELRPNYVVVERDGDVALAGVGLDRTYVGGPWMGPEPYPYAPLAKLRGEKNRNRQAGDVFSLALILRDLIVGKRLFGNSGSGMLEAACDFDGDPSWGSASPAKLCHVLSDCLSLDETRRPKAHAVVQELKPLVEPSAQVELAQWAARRTAVDEQRRLSDGC